MVIVDNATDQLRETRGLLLGFVGVAMFSASLPFTQVAVREFGVIFPSFGRAVIAGLLAAIVLRVMRAPLPPRHLWFRFVLIIAGVVVGFPAFTGLAMQHAPAGHGAVVVGLLPAATAGVAVLRTGVRPSARYWAFAALGAGAIVVLTVARGSSSLALGDGYLVAATIAGAVGYAEGAIVSRELGGWQTISWAVVFALPLTTVITAFGLGPVGFDEPPTAWLSLGYLGVISMFVGFFFWYAGLAEGGIARVSQMQLLQPTLSLTWASLFLDERLDALIVVVALVVVASVAGSRRSAIR